MGKTMPAKRLMRVRLLFSTPSSDAMRAVFEETNLGVLGATEKEVEGAVRTASARGARGTKADAKPQMARKTAT